MFDSLNKKHILLLQGPMGPYFRHLAKELTARGATVTKVNFNGGDAADFGSLDAVEFTAPPEQWPDFFTGLLVNRGITDVAVFGDRRPLHISAIEIAKSHGVPVHVFEEGYLRPNYVTLEREGVNARSTIPRDPEAYRKFASSLPERPPRIGHVFWFAAWRAARYAWAVHRARKRFPHYRHHRDLHPVREGLRWIFVGGYHKLAWKWRDRHALSTMTGELASRYFLVPLQVHNDFQVRGSACSAVETFITEVVRTFATHAPAEAHLVFKHHPLDRAYRNYTQLLTELRLQHGLDGRLHYIADTHLPTLLKHARGTIVLNSTVGLSSLQHGTPTFAVGHAIYSIAGLAPSGSLGDFVKGQDPVDRELVAGFSNYLADHNQIPGCFYKTGRLPRLP